MCDDSIVGEQQKPLLIRICLKDVNNVIFLRPYRIPFRTNDFNDVRIYIRDRNDQDVSFLTPVAAETQRALSEFKEVECNNEPHMPLKNTIKRGKNPESSVNRPQAGGKDVRITSRENPSINPKDASKRRKRQNQSTKKYQRQNEKQAGNPYSRRNRSTKKWHS